MQISYRHGTVEDILSVSAAIPEFENLYAKEVYQERFEHSPKHLILVAYDEDIPVGFKAGYQKTNDGSFYSWMGAVLPAYRKQKIAKNLADQMEDWAKKEGYSSIIFKTRNYLKAMQIFGISNGFHIIDFDKREPIEQSRILLQKYL